MSRVKDINFRQPISPSPQSRYDLFDRIETPLSSMKWLQVTCKMWWNNHDQCNPSQNCISCLKKLGDFIFVFFMLGSTSLDSRCILDLGNTKVSDCEHF